MFSVLDSGHLVASVLARKQAQASSLDIERHVARLFLSPQFTTSPPLDSELADLPMIRNA